MLNTGLRRPSACRRPPAELRLEKFLGPGLGPAVGGGGGLASSLWPSLGGGTDAAAPAAEPLAPATAGDAPETTIPAQAAANTPLPRSYWMVLGVLVLFSLGNSSDTFIMLRASDLGYSPWAVVMVYALYNVTYAALSYPEGALSDRRGRWRIIALGWVIYAVVYAGFALLPAAHAWGMWPLMAVYGVSMALTDGAGKALIADHSPKERRGAAMGIFYALTGLTTLVASLIAGLLWDRSGPAAAFLIGSGFATAALVVLAVVRLAARK